MNDARPSSIRVASGPDGVETYLVATGPAALPPVRTGDLAEAWHAARHAAAEARWGSPRLFRFLGEDGPLDLALTDEDACCWMGAVDQMVSLTRLEGVSLCMRLLALIDLIAKAPWAAGLCRFSRAGATLDPVLLRLAATTALTDQAGFDEASMRDRIGRDRRPPLASPVPPSGALC